VGRLVAVASGQWPVVSSKGKSACDILSCGRMNNKCQNQSWPQLATDHWPLATDCYLFPLLGVKCMSKEYPGTLTGTV